MRLLERHAPIFFPFDTWIYICRVKNQVAEAAEDSEPEILHHISPCHVTAGKPGFCNTGKSSEWWVLPYITASGALILGPLAPTCPEDRIRISRPRFLGIEFDLFWTIRFFTTKQSHLATFRQPLKKWPNRTNRCLILNEGSPCHAKDGII